MKHIGVLLFIASLCGCTHVQVSTGSALPDLAVSGIVNLVGPTATYYAGKEAAIIGLHQLTPDNGRVVAGDIIVASDAATAYLQGGNLPTADIVNQVVTGHFANLDPAIATMIASVSGTLGSYVPNYSTYLTENQTAYLLKFVAGLHDGATAYLADNTVKIAPKYSLKKEQDKAEKKLRRIEAERGVYPPWFSGLIRRRQ